MNYKGYDVHHKGEQRVDLIVELQLSPKELEEWRRRSLHEGGHNLSRGIPNVRAVTVAHDGRVEVTVESTIKRITAGDGTTLASQVLTIAQHNLTCLLG